MFAGVAGRTSANDVAHSCGTAATDRNKVVYGQRSVLHAVGAFVIECIDNPPPLLCCQVMCAHALPPASLCAQFGQSTFSRLSVRAVMLCFFGSILRAICTKICKVLSLIFGVTPPKSIRIALVLGVTRLTVTTRLAAGHIKTSQRQRHVALRTYFRIHRLIVPQIARMVHAQR